MSSESTIVTADHFAYIAARTTAEDEFLRQLRADADAAGIPPIHVAPEQAAFLQILLRVSGVFMLLATFAIFMPVANAMARPCVVCRPSASM